MKDELKTRWVAALRSGDYRQCQRILKDDDYDTYCCLGVLIDVADQTYFDSDHRNEGYNFIREKLGLNNDQMRDLWMLNDTQNQTFDQIADHIEEWL